MLDFNLILVTTRGKFLKFSFCAAIRRRGYFWRMGCLLLWLFHRACSWRQDLWKMGATFHQILAGLVIHQMHELYLRIWSLFWIVFVNNIIWTRLRSNLDILHLPNRSKLSEILLSYLHLPVRFLPAHIERAFILALDRLQIDHWFCWFSG